VAYLGRNHDIVTWVERRARTCLLVPLLKENELIGVIAILRDRVLPFTDNQIDLLRAYAAEAIVAFESTRRDTGTCRSS